MMETTNKKYLWKNDEKTYEIGGEEIEEMAYMGESLSYIISSNKQGNDLYQLIQERGKELTNALYNTVENVTAIDRSDLEKFFESYGISVRIDIAKDYEPINDYVVYSTWDNQFFLLDQDFEQTQIAYYFSGHRMQLLDANEFDITEIK